MKNKNIPQVRFPGYTGDWKLSELSDFLSHLKSGLSRMLSNQDIGLPVIRANNIKNGMLDIVNDIKYWYIDDPQGANTQNYLIRKNDILVNFINSEAKMGTAAIVDSEPKRPTIYTTNILNLRMNQDANPYFIYSLTMTQKYKNYIQTITKPAVNQASFTTVDFKKYTFLAPIIEEQTKIGEFFKHLDDTIALHQRELTTLKQTKQGFLQKMFPKEGESVPEVRFPGFTEDWEQRNFFDNIKNTIDFRGRTPKKLGLEWSESGYLALSALNVKNGYIDLSADAHYGDEELYKKWMGGRELKQGQVLFTTEAPMGNVAQVPDNKGYILSQRTIAFDVHENKITNDFLRILLCSPKVFNELSSLSSGGTAKGVSQRSLSQLKVEVPRSLEEQNKIGDFFKQLDDTITLHKRELDTLKETKKAFLQKLFV